MKLLRLFCITCAWITTGAHAQDILGDLLAGKLIRPEVGVFAWYDLTDNATGQKFYLRQAIVAAEKVKRETGYWLETELTPPEGFPAVYKMLLTGPANDADNIHRMIVKEGSRNAEEIRDPVPIADGGQKPDSRESLGKETVELPQGDVEAEHLVLTHGEKKTEVWVSEDVRPLGIVRVLSPSGELMLRRYGVGGPDAESAIEEIGGRSGTVHKPDAVKVELESGKPTRNFSGRKKENNND